MTPPIATLDDTSRLTLDQRIVSHGMVPASSWPDEAERRVYGEKGDQVLLSAVNVLEGLARDVSALESSRDLTPAGKSKARSERIASAYGALAATFGPPAREVAEKIETTRHQAGGTRRMNPLDIGIDSSSLTPFAADVVNRVALARAELLKLKDGELQTVLRSAHGVTADAPDAVVVYAVDGLPQFLREHLERRAGENLDALRMAYFRRSSPASFAACDVWEGVGRNVVFGANAALRALERAAQSTDLTAQERVAASIRPLTAALGDVATDATTVSG